MTRTIDIDQMSEQLKTLVEQLKPDDEILLMNDSEIVARITPAKKEGNLRGAGLCAGMITLPDEEDDEYLEHFKEYMP